MYTVFAGYSSMYSEYANAKDNLCAMIYPAVSQAENMIRDSMLTSGDARCIHTQASAVAGPAAKSDSPS